MCCSTGPPVTRRPQRLASATLSAALAPEEEAKIRLRLPTVTTDTTTRHIEENRRALQLPHLSDVTRARHRAWLAYNLPIHGQRGQGARRPTRRPRRRIHRRPRVEHPVRNGTWPASTARTDTRAARHRVRGDSSLDPRGRYDRSSPRCNPPSKSAGRGRTGRRTPRRWSRAAQKNPRRNTTPWGFTSGP